MPSIAQQDYIIIDAVFNSSVMNVIVSADTFVELQKYMERPLVLFSILLHYRDASGTDKGYGTIIAADAVSKSVLVTSADRMSTTSLIPVGYMGSIENCETLAILEKATDTYPVKLRKEGTTNYLYFTATGSVKTYVAVNGKYVTVTLNASDVITALEVTDTEIPEGNAFVNLTEEELMKLIGAPRIM